MITSKGKTVASASAALFGLAVVWGTTNMISHDREVRREAAEQILSMVDAGTFSQTFEVAANEVTYRAQVTPGAVDVSGTGGNPYIVLGNPAFDCWDVRLRVVEGEDEEPFWSGIWGSEITETIYRDAGRNSGSCHANSFGQDNVPAANFTAE